jgi:hypothetical protein
MIVSEVHELMDDMSGAPDSGSDIKLQFVLTNEEAVVLAGRPTLADGEGP